VLFVFIAKMLKKMNHLSKCLQDSESKMADVEPLPDLPKDIIENILYQADLTIDTRIALNVSPKKCVIPGGLKEKLAQMHKRRSHYYAQKMQFQKEGVVYDCMLDSFNVKKTYKTIPTKKRLIEMHIDSVDSEMLLQFNIGKICEIAEELDYESQVCYNMHTGESMNLIIDNMDDGF
jgi:hypothetical protein